MINLQNLLKVTRPRNLCTICRNDILPAKHLSQRTLPSNLLSSSKRGIVTRHILPSINVSHILDNIPGQDKLTPEFLLEIVDNIYNTMYNKVLSLPWAFYESRSVLHLQTILNSDIRYEFEHLVAHPGFKQLHLSLEQLACSLDNQILVQLLSKLQYLHVDLAERCIISLLSECQNRYSNFDWTEICTFADIANSYIHSGFVLKGKLTELLRERLSTMEPTSESFRVLAHLMKQLSYFASNHLKTLVFDKVTDCMENCEIGTNDLLHLVEAYIHQHSSQNVNFINRSIVHLEEHLHQFSFLQLARVSLNLKFIEHQKNVELQQRLWTRAEECLQMDIKAVDVAHLVIAFNPNMPKSTRNLLESKIIENVEYFDVLCIKHLATALRTINCNNRHVLDKFQETIHNRLSDVINTLSCLNSVLKLYSYSTNYERSFQLHLTSVLLQRQDTAHFNMPSSMSVLLRYFIATKNNNALSTVFEKANNLIPQFDISHILEVCRGLNRLKLPLSSYFYRKIKLLYDNLIQNAILKQDEIQSLVSLNRVIRKLFLLGPLKSLGELQRFMMLFPKFSHQLSPDNIRMMTNVFNLTTFYLPEVLEAVVDYFCSHPQDMTFHDGLNVLSVISRFNHFPKRWDELQNICLKLYEENKQVLNIPDTVRFAHCFTLLQCSPSQLIKDIFNLEFLQKFNLLCQASHQKSSSDISNLLMLLNRNLVLEHPECNVPWCHEEFCQEMLTFEKSNNLVYALQQVYDGLVLLLGNSEYVRRDFRTPYYHTIDFECILNKAGKPLPISSVSDKQCPTEIERVAVLLFPRSYYCANTDRLLANAETKKRQLEILGYRVVEIPYNYWNSPLKYGQNEQHEFLQKQIFKNKDPEKNYK